LGYWGLGIGDWAQSPIQSPIPNPQSPIPKLMILNKTKNNLKKVNKKKIKF
jgi:hypothetical protein